MACMILSKTGMIFMNKTIIVQVGIILLLFRGILYVGTTLACLDFDRKQLFSRCIGCKNTSMFQQ